MPTTTSIKNKNVLPQKLIRTGLMLTILFIVASYQRHPILVSLQRSYNENNFTLATSESWLISLLPLISQLKWISFSACSIILGLAYQRYFMISGLPSSFWEIPTFIGSTHMMIPTLYYACGLLCVISSTSNQMIYFLGLSVELFRVAALLSACHCGWNLAPDVVRGWFDFSEEEDDKEEDEEVEDSYEVIEKEEYGNIIDKKNK
jgi:hypothetical protein